jgi:uncharacterized membrane protein
MAVNRSSIFLGVLVVLLGIMLVTLALEVWSEATSQESAIVLVNENDIAAVTAGPDPIIGTWKSSFGDSTHTFSTNSEGRIIMDSKLIIKLNSIFPVSFVELESTKAVKNINLYFISLRNDPKRYNPFYAFGFVDGTLYYFRSNDETWDEPGSYYAVDKYTRVS